MHLFSLRAFFGSKSFHQDVEALKWVNSYQGNGTNFYLDDMAIISSSRELSSQEAGIVVRILESLGDIINNKKRFLFSPPKKVFLGYV